MMKFQSPRTESLSAYAPALLSGLVLGPSGPFYPAVPTGWLAWVALVPLLLDLREKRTLRAELIRVAVTSTVTALFFTSFLLLASPWGYVAGILVSSSVFWVPLASLSLLRRVLGWRGAAFVLPFLWTFWEWLYNQAEFSFAAIRLGHSQVEFWWLVQYVDVTGVNGVSCWVALLNVLLAMAIDARARLRPPQFRARIAIVITVMFGLPISYGAVVWWQTSPKPTITVALVQPNWNPWQEKSPQALQRSIEHTAAAIARQHPDLVIWHEGAAPALTFSEQADRATLQQAVNDWRTPLLTGTTDRQNGLIYNAAVLLTPTTTPANDYFFQDKYYKRRLYPFVERAPYVDRFAWLQRFRLQIGTGGEYTPGTAATVFTFQDQQGVPHRVATMLCYEQMYPEQTAEFVRSGAEFLAIQTNEGWFSQTHGPHLLAALSRLRAIELRRSLARAANTGITTFIDPWGRMYGTVPWWSEQVATATVTLSHDLTFYARYPNAFALLCGALVLGLTLSGWRWQQRSYLDSYLDSRLVGTTTQAKSQKPFTVSHP
jgi:apolipoprotein N-acyltransferase